MELDKATNTGILTTDSIVVSGKTSDDILLGDGGTTSLAGLEISRDNLVVALTGEVDLGSVSGVTNIDCSLGVHFIFNMTGATSLTFSNYSTEKFKNITLQVTGNFTLTQPSTVQGDWSGISGTGTNQIFIYLFDVITPEFSSSLLSW